VIQVYQIEEVSHENRFSDDIDLVHKSCRGLLCRVTSDIDPPPPQPFTALNRLRI